MNFFKWTLFFVALGAFIWFIFFKPMNTATKTDLATTVDTSLTEESGEYIPERTVEDSQIEENTQEKNEPEEPIVSEISEDGAIDLNSKYLIVVGSFGVKKNADRMLKRVTGSGKNGVITKIRNLHRVVTASTDDEQDAEQLKSHFTHVYKERAFILEQ